MGHAENDHCSCTVCPLSVHECMCLGGRCDQHPRSVWEYRRRVPDVQTDGGFACLITGTEKTILFDTGKDGSILLHNLEKLRVDCDRIDIVVLSHFHQDHLGGLNAFLKRHAKVSIYVPRSFLKRPDFQQAIAGFDSRVIPVTAPQPICREVYSTGMMGEGIHEQALVIHTEKGSIVIAGCAHPGIIAVLKRAKEVGGGNIRYVLGGFHLMDLSQAEMKEIVRQLQALGVRSVSAIHCTGEMPVRLFQKAYQEDFIPMGVGKRVSLDGLP